MMLGNHAPQTAYEGHSYCTTWKRVNHLIMYLRFCNYAEAEAYLQR